MTRLTGDVGDLTSQIATMDDAGVQSSISKQLIPSTCMRKSRGELVSGRDGILEVRQGRRDPAVVGGHATN